MINNNKYSDKEKKLTANEGKKFGPHKMSREPVFIISITFGLFAILTYVYYENFYHIALFAYLAYSMGAMSILFFVLVIGKKPVGHLKHKGTSNLGRFFSSRIDKMNKIHRMHKIDRLNRKRELRDRRF